MIAKLKAKRAFTGLIGSSFSSVNVTEEQQIPARDASRGSVAEIVAKQVVQAKKEQAKSNYIDTLEHEGWEAGDDQPIDQMLKSTRGRSNGSVRFQRYQFRLRTTGDRNARFDRGFNPAAWGSMDASRHVRQSELDSEGTATETLYRETNMETAPSDKSVSIANVAQSMPKGFSVGVLSASLQYIEIPRERTPETAWVFDDSRLKYFVSCLVSDDALASCDLNDWDTLHPFVRAVKTYACIYLYFRLGKTDKGFLSDDDLWRARFWKTTNALKRYRSRLVKQGLKMFGTPADPKFEFPDYDAARVERAWKMVLRVYRK